MTEVRIRINVVNAITYQRKKKVINRRFGFARKVTLTISCRVLINLLWYVKQRCKKLLYNLLKQSKHENAK